MRVLLAEDHTMVRQGIRELLSDFPDITQIVEVSDGREAMKAVMEHRPDIVLMDISMPRMNGLEATSRIVKQSPHTRVIILSMHGSEDFVRRALRAGASGYLVKAATVAELGDALRSVERGRIYISAALKKKMNSVPNATKGPLERLTPRQREILQLIAEGLSSREIAAALRIRLKTVESHRTQLMSRLGIHDVAGLVRFAMRQGIVGTE
jgi:DNA-binding NarL/FixJ family response regulator